MDSWDYDDGGMMRMSEGAGDFIAIADHEQALAAERERGDALERDRDIGEVQAENAELRGEVERLREERDHYQHCDEEHAKARTCVSCGGFICGPMQCGPCIEREEPTGDMMYRPATTNLRERGERLADDLERLEGVVGELAQGFKDKQRCLARVVEVLEDMRPMDLTSQEQAKAALAAARGEQ